ncbi:MAG TPA: NHL repeat-containing protein [Baekduia sp.]|uniref:NHL repeat-containing protein n=1 Tax=Baekduia sp. TaxID=2600305 RepID=UPI002D791ABA|nr:NHL repeat-containing protein [Baekduia sp.]HET6507535.1 NHL repeat-containing protein [Baekduia sp.]
MIGRIALLGTVVALAGSAVAADAGQASTATTSFGDAPGVLRLPEAVAVAPDGDLLVGDHFSGRVQRFRDGRLVGAFGLRGQGCGRLGAVGGLAADTQGNTYVLDSDQQLVQVFGPDGASLRCFGGNGSGPGRMRTGSGAYAASSASGGIAVAGGFVYVADTGNDRVQRFTLDGKNPKIFGKGKLDTPQGLAVKGTRLLVADDGHHRIAELDTTTGRLVRDSAGVELRFPYDVALDARGGAYVADNNLHRIVQLDRRLKRVRAWGTQGSGHGRFVFPRAVAVLHGGGLVVADAGNDRVQQFTATGRFVRAIGLDGRKPPHVTAPADVAVNALGEVAVADGNGRISWFSLGGAYYGGWAQSRSFQESTAVVSSPNGIDFAGDHAVRVADGGEVREYAAGAVRRLLRNDPGSGPGAATIDVAPDGAQWAARADGRFARIEQGRTPTWLGVKLPFGRSANAIAALADGTIAVAEGTSPHQDEPADGTILRYDLTGHRVGTWAVPRPAGGLPSRPSGLVATPDGGAWASDAANDRLLRFAPDGTIAQTLGAPGTGDGQLAEPRGLDLDCAGGLVVADSGNDRIVRFANVADTTTGCGSVSAPTAVAGRPPRPVGLKLRTLRRVARPAARLGSIRASCQRTCTTSVSEATVGVYGHGGAKTYNATATRVGRTFVIKIPAATAAKLRSRLRAGAAVVTAGVVVTATAGDGVQDTAAVTWTFH